VVLSKGKRCGGMPEAETLDPALTSGRLPGNTARGCTRGNPGDGQPAVGPRTLGYALVLPASCRRRRLFELWPLVQARRQFGALRDVLG
jgi:hypothetical protein